MPKQTTPPETLFLALGDPTRLAVVTRLCQGPGSVSELHAPFSMAMPSFLQHLGVLEASGWILTTKSGRVRTCSLNPQALKDAGSWLEKQRGLWERRMDQFDAYVLKLKAEGKQP